MIHPEPTVANYIKALKASPDFGRQIVHHEIKPESAASYTEVAKPWPIELEQALIALEINQLYSHQAMALDSIRNGENMVVATPTASGKSLIYNLPVFEKILHKPETRALYLFPLKALAQDQLKGILEFINFIPEHNNFIAAIYDGDTTAYHRKKLREQPPHILITNPDMLHFALLAYHDRWGSFFSGLTHVVLDEVHTYRGVFGSHMSGIIKRLTRICSHYGSDPQFILSSATVGNPAEVSKMLLGRDITVIDQSHAPQAKRHFILINPYDSPTFIVSQLLEAAVKRGLRTIVYTQSRKVAELLYTKTKRRLGSLAGKLSSYRAGYTPEERREIEKNLSSGQLTGVIATSALELGIDIGDLDICILAGYPGTVMTTWQRSGRVGRSMRESLTILVAQQDALDQYFMRYPQELFTRKIEDIVINPTNKTIMKAQLACAAAELPLLANEPILRNEKLRQIVKQLTVDGVLLESAEGNRWFSNRKYPQRDIDLRGSGQSLAIRKEKDGSVLGEIDNTRCFKECYPGAIYLHKGATWLVVKLDLDGREVIVRRQNVHYFTKPVGNKETTILDIYQVTDQGDIRISFGSLRVTERITGFQRRSVNHNKLLSHENLQLPPLLFETEGLWVELPLDIQKNIEKGQFHFMGGIHAIEHGMIGIFPLLVLCDRNDVGGIACPFHEQLPGAGIFIYDGYQGGVGLTKKAFEKISDLLQTTLKTIEECPCEIGCPSCIHSPKCGSGNRPMDKKAAKIILKNLIRKRSSADEHQDYIRKNKSSPKKSKTTDCNKQKTSASKTPPQRYGVFDLETKHSAAEVGGWHHSSKMGMSVAVVYDALQDDYFTYLEKDIPQLIDHLQQLELVVGFNNKRFDYRVLSAYTAFNLATLPTLDILEEITTRLGYRLSLQKLVEHSLGEKKTADGLQALKWYKEGKINEIVEYCRHDVDITRRLYLYGLTNNFLLFENKAGNIVRLPVKF